MRKFKKIFYINFSIFIVILEFIFLSNSLSAATYYVSVTGDDNNPGTETQPWRTIQKAFRIIAPGDKIIVASGIYQDPAITSISGTSENPIMIIGPSDKSAVITGRWTIKHSYYVIKGFHFRGIDLILEGTKANYNIIDSNKFTENIQGIYMLLGDADNNGVNGPSYNIIRNNEFTNNKGNGCVVTIGTGNLIESNYFHDLPGWDALRIWGVGTIIKKNIFQNIISGTEAGISNHADIIQTFESSTGIWAKNIIFEQNKIIDCSCQFGNLEAGKGNISNWTFRNNLFIRSRLQINIYVPEVKFYNNTVFYNSSSLGFRFAYSTDKGAAHNGEVFNNIFIRCNGTYSFNTSLSGCISDYNLATNLTDGQVDGPIKTEIHSINGGYAPNKIFTDPDKNDFTLVAGSPAINSGMIIPGVVTDINGLDRTTKLYFDMGAYMYPQNQTKPISPTGLRIIKSSQ